MPKSKAEIQRALGLSAPPDDAVLALLEELGEGEVVTGATPVAGPGYSAEELLEELEEAVVADSVGELLWKAREETGRSLREAGEIVGVSHARVRELEHSSNMEVATLARVARALGYRVRIVLQPMRPAGKGRKLDGPARALSTEL